MAVYSMTGYASAQTGAPTGPTEGEVRTAPQRRLGMAHMAWVTFGCHFLKAAAGVAHGGVKRLRRNQPSLAQGQQLPGTRVGRTGGHGGQDLAVIGWHERHGPHRPGRA